MTEPVIYFADGFDTYGGSNAAFSSRFYSTNGGGPSITAITGGAFGGEAVFCSGQNIYLPVPKQYTLSELVVGARWYNADPVDNRSNYLLFADDNFNSIAYVEWNCINYPTIIAYNGSGTQLASVNNNFNARYASWFELEAKLVMGTATAEMIVCLNGNTIISLGSLNIVSSTGAIRYGGIGFQSSGAPIYADDLYGSDTLLTTVCGPMGPRFYTATTTTDKQKEWNPSSGTVDATMVADVNGFDGEVGS